jgi:cyclopropane-fatty-acyl-phospholipid synthase
VITALSDLWIRAAVRRAIARQLACPPGLHVPEPPRETLPAGFFALCLGPRLKYSCGLWSAPDTTLAEAEDAMLALTSERAGLEDGMDVLDLGAGWGALALWVASLYPRSRVLAVVNHEAQASFIRARGLSNVEVQCADVRGFAPARRFDRVLAVELFEPFDERAALLEGIATWLKPGGRLFLHSFAHRAREIRFARGSGLGRRLFTGGTIPTDAQLVPPGFACLGSWTINGREYARTIETWRANLDAARGDAVAALARAPGPAQGDVTRARRLVRQWRLFLLAGAELFAWNGGEEFRILHGLYEPALRPI